MSGRSRQIAGGEGGTWRTRPGRTGANRRWRRGGRGGGRDGGARGRRRRGSGRLAGATSSAPSGCSSSARSSSSAPSTTAIDRRASRRDPGRCVLRAWRGRRGGRGCGRLGLARRVRAAGRAGQQRERDDERQQRAAGHQERASAGDAPAGAVAGAFGAPSSRRISSRCATSTRRALHELGSNRQRCGADVFGARGGARFLVDAGEGGARKPAVGVVVGVACRGRALGRLERLQLGEEGIALVPHISLSISRGRRGQRVFARR